MKAIAYEGEVWLASTPYFGYQLLQITSRLIESWKSAHYVAYTLDNEVLDFLGIKRIIWQRDLIERIDVVDFKGGYNGN